MIVGDNIRVAFKVRLSNASKIIAKLAPSAMYGTKETIEAIA
jgi:hypothetical protein